MSLCGAWKWFTPSTTRLYSLHVQLYNVAFYHCFVGSNFFFGCSLPFVLVDERGCGTRQSPQPLSPFDTIAIIILGSPNWIWCINASKVNPMLQCPMSPSRQRRTWLPCYNCVANLIKTRLRGNKKDRRAVARVVTITLPCLSSRNHYSAHLLAHANILLCLWASDRLVYAL